jgi:hypothetical protein
MASKRKKPQKKDTTKDLWISPRFNLKGKDGNRAWDLAGNLTADSGARFLELADIALGLKKAEKRKKPASVPAHVTRKIEPYSS